MSNENQETIADIVRKMRRLADEAERGDCYDLRGLGTDSLRAYADRIEAAHSRFYDKYKEHTNELNRQILVLKREKEISDTYFYGYDPEEALVAQCSTCRFFYKKYSHCKLHDSLTNAKYKCSGWEFKTNKECADEYKAEINREFAELRAENARLRAALKPVLECSMVTDVWQGSRCKDAVREAQHIYNGGGEKQKEGAVQ